MNTLIGSKFHVQFIESKYYHIQYGIGRCCNLEFYFVKKEKKMKKVTFGNFLS